MTKPVTVLAPIKLAKGKSESDLLAASDLFQKHFANSQPGVLRRELVRTGEGTYLDIVQFRSAEDAQDVMVKEQGSKVCHAFFAVMDMAGEKDFDLELLPSIATYL